MSDARAVEPNALESPSPTGWLERFDALIERWGDRVNPIVVRETRQEFKGARFQATLFLSLIVAWIAAVFGVMARSASGRQSEIGDELFATFYIVLAFVVCVMVPFGLFRSMTSEFVGHTWELLVVTPMGAAKIVRGKLATSMLQMLLYMALLAPFMCFTYLLRGIGVLHIVLGLGLLVVASFCLCHVALFCGSLIRRSAWEGLGLIVLIGTCLFGWGIVSTVVVNATSIDIGSWIGGGICVVIAMLYMVIVAFAVATASLTPTAPPPSPGAMAPTTPAISAGGRLGGEAHR